MIFALEGPDCCGKTTLFNALKGHVSGVRWVPKLPMADALMPFMRDVDIRQEALWRALYDARQTYVCDRHFSVTSLVYGELYGREPVDVSVWVPQVRVVYLEVPIDELLSRHARTHSNTNHFDVLNYARCIDLYEKHLPKFKHVRFDGATEALAKRVHDYIEDERC